MINDLADEAAKHIIVSDGLLTWNYLSTLDAVTTVKNGHNT